MPQSTYASSTAEGGNLGTLFSRGSGAGNYTVASQANYTILDPTNLNAGSNVFIPTGFCAIVSAGGSIGTLVAAVATSVGLFVDGALVLEQQITGPGIAAPATFANYSNFGLNWLVKGDGKYHTIQLGFRTANASDAISILNDVITRAPYLMVEITQNSFAAASTFASSMSEAQGKLGAQLVTGSGAGNYSSSSKAFQPVDGGGGQLTVTTLIPKGFVLLVASGGVVGSTHAGDSVAVGLAVDGVVKTEQDITPHGTSQLSPFGLSYAVFGDGGIHSVSLMYHTQGASATNVTIGNSSATHVPFILAELTQSNFTGQNTDASSLSEGGKLGCIFLSGAGSGNYQTNSQSFVNVDSNLLSQTIVVPKGYVLMVSANGVAGNNGTGVAEVSVGISVDGILKAESINEGAATGNLVGFDVQYMIVGDGLSHTVSMVYRVNTSSNNAVIGNSPVTNVPSLLLELTQSNLN
jgi:hypothetical protein